MICPPSRDPRIRPVTDAFFAVYNYYGYGLSESVYSGALEFELTDRGHKVAREVAVNVEYKGRHVAWQRLDMIVDGQIIVEIKATELLPPYAKRQLLNYLSVTTLDVGLVLHFGPEPRYHRMLQMRKRPSE